MTGTSAEPSARQIGEGNHLSRMGTFFRDPDAWAALQARVVGPLVTLADPDQPLRVWVPGCATGEEAYSMAILFHEEFERRKVTRHLRIFASDIDTAALAFAREAVYPGTIRANVSDERLARYFRVVDDRYRISSEIRDHVVFAPHDLLRDPPFLRLQLISCRNVLLHLDPGPWQQIMTVFRYACSRDGGYLFLGEFEDVTDDLFRPVDTQHRIFASVQLSDARRFPLAELAIASASSAGPRGRPALEQGAQPSVVVDTRWNLVHATATAAPFFQDDIGPAPARLMDRVKPELRDELHTALQRALESSEVEVSPFVRVSLADTPHRVAMLVQRQSIGVDGQVQLVVTFLDGGTDRGELPTTVMEPSSVLVQGLRDKLRDAEQRIDRLRHEQFVRSEDLRAAHEQLQCLEQEYRSTTAELETSKQQLRSINEELQLVNEELKLRVDDLLRTNSDLENLMRSTDVATLFLTTDLRIRRHTPALEAIFDLRAQDYGRPIADKTHTLEYDGLQADARAVLATASAIEREVTSRDGRAYVLRMHPYQSGIGDGVDGVVLTFLDVTDLRRAQRQIADELRRMTRLHALGIRLARPANSGDMLADVLRVTLGIVGADMGHIQRWDDDGTLTIAAQHGFEQPFLRFFARVRADSDAACAAAMASRHRVTVEDLATNPIYAGSSAYPVLESEGVRACQSTPLFDLSGRFLGFLSTYYRKLHDFEPGELQWLDLLAQHAASVVEREHADQQLARARAELEERVVDRTRWLSLMHETARAINEASSWNDALHAVLRCLCQSEYWQVGYIYLPDSRDPDVVVPGISYLADERFRAFHELSQRQRYRRGQSLPGRVFADNQPIWIDDPQELVAALPLRARAVSEVGPHAAVGQPITLGSEVVAVLELISDTPHVEIDQVTTLLRDVATQIAGVLERERTTARVADLLWREQQSLLHTLHDSLGQTLTGLGMLSSSLRQRLAGVDPSAAESAAQIAQQTQHALEQIRQLARNLFPVEVDAESLIAALRDLASTTQALHGLAVRVDVQTPLGLHNGKVATELYRIAQEALTNVVKHAHASKAVISIGRRPGRLELRIADDGVGLADATASDGMGLRIMRYRADTVGARLTVERGPRGGTVVTCVLPDSAGRP